MSEDINMKLYKYQIQENTFIRYRVKLDYIGGKLFFCVTVGLSVTLI